MKRTRGPGGRVRRVVTAAFAVTAAALVVSNLAPLDVAWHVRRDLDAKGSVYEGAYRLLLCGGTCEARASRAWVWDRSGDEVRYGIARGVDSFRPGLVVARGRFDAGFGRYWFNDDGIGGPFYTLPEPFGTGSEWMTPIAGQNRAIASWVTCPIWPFVAVPAGWLFAAAAARFVRVRRRLRAGLCQRCGYDLRGTSGRCPECGTARQTARPTIEL